MNPQNHTPLEVIVFAQQMDFPIRYLDKERVLGPRKGASPALEGTEICVKNLPHKIFENKIVPIFAKVGQIYKTRIMLAADLSSNKGTAYITFLSPDEAKRALELNNSEIIPGFRIRVALANDNRRIFVSGIPVDKKRQDIWHELLRAGFKHIIDVIMYRSFANANKNRGFIFVELPTHQEAEKALKKFKTVTLFGRRVYSDWSTPLNMLCQSKYEEIKSILLKNLNIFEQNDVNNIFRSVLKDDYDTIESIHWEMNFITVKFKTKRDAKKAMCLLKEYFQQFNPKVELTWVKPKRENVDIRKDERFDSPPCYSKDSDLPSDEYCRSLLLLAQNMDLVSLNQD